MADSLQPGEIVERYEVVRRIGIGGMAEVYLVRHVTLHTVHALKILTLSGPTLHDRMEEEGRIQAHLRHPNVVHVSDVLFVRGMPALVMEFVDGPDLKAWIAENRPDARRAEQVFRGIVAGVAAAHAAGVIHRDLKPANVLLATVDGGLLPKVGDFGIVKVVRGEDTNRTRTGLPMGTPQYMAPEQMRDAASVDQRADLFSLGCILYELLTWEQAYGGSDLIDIFVRIDRGQRAPLPVGVPDHLRLLIDRCLARDPDARPSDCATLLAWLDGATIPDLVVQRPRPPVRPAPTMPWVWVLALIGGVATILLVTVAIVGLVGPGAMRGITTSPAACSTTGGRLGYAEAPAVFGKKPGSIWTVRVETPVIAAPGPEAPVICVLPAGAQVTVPADPVVADGRKWVSIDGDQIVLGMPIVDEEDPDEVVGELCRGPAGVRIGWFHTKPIGLGVPKAGKTWRVSVAKQVVADYPRKENGNRAGPPVCALPEDAEIEIVAAPVKAGFNKGYWVPVTGSD